MTDAVFPANPVVGQSYLTPGGLLFQFTAQGAWKLVQDPNFITSLPKNMHAGVGAPSLSIGADGDYYYDTASKLLYGPRAGGAWGSGTTLMSAALMIVGSTIGGVAPSGGTGIDGQYFLDMGTGKIWGPKATGSWPGSPAFTCQTVSGAIMGGHSASAAPSNSVGYDGQLFLDLDSGKIWGPKATGTWPGSPAIDPTLKDANVVSGSTAGVIPGSGVGSDGDYFIDRDTGTIWGPKATGAWPTTPHYAAAMGAVISGGGDITINLTKVGCFIHVTGATHRVTLPDATSPGMAGATFVFQNDSNNVQYVATSGVDGGGNNAFQGPGGSGTNVISVPPHAQAVISTNGLNYIVPDLSQDIPAATTTKYGLSRQATTIEAINAVTSGTVTPAFLTPEAALVLLQHQPANLAGTPVLYSLAFTLTDAAPVYTGTWTPICCLSDGSHSAPAGIIATGGYTSYFAIWMRIA